MTQLEFVLYMIAMFGIVCLILSFGSKWMIGELNEMERKVDMKEERERKAGFLK